MRAELLRAKARTIGPREDLRRLLGLSGSDARWSVQAGLPGLPDGDPALRDMIDLARAERLELAAARANQAVVNETLETARFWRYFGGVELGAMAHKEQGEPNWVAGPSLALEIPLFDQRQAQIAKLEAFKRQGEAELNALAIDVRADVRSSSARVITARGVVEQYAKVVVPLRESVVRYSQEQYDAMLLGVYQLIQAKQEEFEAYREYIEALRDYWVAKSDLERAVGRRIGAPSPAVVHNPAAAVAPPPAHSH